MNSKTFAQTKKTVHEHQWEMINVNFGFIVFEKCFQCKELRTYFSEEDHPLLGDRYREADHHWTRMENAQSFQFDLRCRKCGHVEKFTDLMGLMHCTGCMADCELDILRRKYELEKTWIIVAFGFLPEAMTRPISDHRLAILSDYFNQRRDTSRSSIKILPFHLIKDLPRCRGVFMHDVGMLSESQPPVERKPVF